MTIPNESKLICVEDSYGAIDRDYDDFYWRLEVVGIKPQQFTLQSTVFIRENYIDHPFNNPLQPNTVFQGDERMDPTGATLFNPALTRYRTRQILTLSPMDIYHGDNLALLNANTTYTPSIGVTNEYDKASSVSSGKIVDLAKADNVLNDNFLRHKTGTAPLTGLVAQYSAINAYEFVLRMDTTAGDPLISPNPPQIDFDIVILFDYHDPLNPTAQFGITNDGFPC